MEILRIGKRSHAKYRVVVHVGDASFDSATIRLTLKTPRAARWLGRMVEKAMHERLYQPPGSSKLGWRWQGDRSFDDECVCEHGGLLAHVEWLDGRRGDGGEYYFSVGAAEAGGALLVHSTDHFDDFEARGAVASRFVCELVIALAVAGQTAIVEDWSE